MLSKIKSCHSGAVFINHWQMIANVLSSQHLKWLISSTLTYKAICCNYSEYMTLSSLKHWHVCHICRSHLSPLLHQFGVSENSVRKKWKPGTTSQGLWSWHSNNFVYNSSQNSLMQSEYTGDSTAHFCLSSFTPISKKKKNILSQLFSVEFSKTFCNSNVSLSRKSSQQLSDPFTLTQKCTYISTICVSGPA